MTRFLPRGRLVPVSPGTAFATSAARSRPTSTAESRPRRQLRRPRGVARSRAPSGEIRRIDPQTDPGLFAATIGGIGLTGVILRVGFRLQAGAVGERGGRGAPARRSRRRSRGARRGAGAAHLLGRLDRWPRARPPARSRHSRAAEPAPADARRPRLAKPRNVPFDFPACALNPLSIAAPIRRAGSRPP